jgi:hypothetical protein
VVVVYEDGSTRDLAMHVCNSLIQNLEGELEFEFTWCKFKHLRYSEIARQTGHAAARADLILLSVGRAADLAAEVRTWFEGWLSQRRPLGGALAVIQTATNPGEQPAAEELYLRLVAERAKLDYLPLSGLGPVPLYNDRPGEAVVVPATAVPDEFANHQPHSTGWGINE